MRRAARVVGATALALTSLWPLVPLVAQISPPEHATFAELEWGTTRDAVKARLLARGYEYKKIEKDSDLTFTGRLMGERALVFAYFTQDGRLAKVAVNLLTKDADAIARYRDVVSTLATKYGVPADSFEIYKPPFERGDGYEETAIRTGKAHFLTYWPGKRLLADIEDDLTVMIQYESPAWHAEAQRRRKASDM